MPYARQTFDRVIVIDAFHHLRRQETAAQELMRVLAPGGLLVIDEPDVAHWGVKLAALGEKLLLMRSRFYTLEAIRAMFERAGGQVCVDRQGHTGWVTVEAK